MSAALLSTDASIEQHCERRRQGRERLTRCVDAILGSGGG